MLSFTVDLADCVQLNVLDVMTTFVSSLFYVHKDQNRYIRLLFLFPVFSFSEATLSFSPF